MTGGLALDGTCGVPVHVLCMFLINAMHAHPKRWGKRGTPRFAQGWLATSVHFQHQCVRHSVVPLSSVSSVPQCISTVHGHSRCHGCFSAE